MKFVPFHELDGVPNIAVDGSAHKDSKLVLSHWIDSGTDQNLMRDTSAQIVLDFLKNKNKIPDGVSAVSNDHFDQDGLIGIFSLVEQELAIDNYEFLIDIATSGDFGKYKDRNAARVSMALARLVHPSSGMISKETFNKPYPEMAAAFYQKGIEILPEFISNINKYQELWDKEDQFLSECEENIKNGKIQIEEFEKHDLAIVTVSDELEENEFHRFTVIRVGPVHDMALHNATQMGRVIYSYRGKIHFRYRYETWVQLEENTHPLRVDLKTLESKLSEIDSGKWLYDGSNRLVPLLKREDGSKTNLTIEEFKDLIINEFDNGEVNWNPYPH